MLMTDLFIDKTSNMWINLLLMRRASAPSVTYATWNPSDKDAWVTLSNGNLTAVATANARKSARATLAKSTGKWYREVKLDSNATNWHFMAWVCTSWATLSNYISVTSNWWVFYEDFAATPYKWNAWFAWYGSEFVPWDILWIALDIWAWSLTFYRNNTSMWVAFASWVTGTLYPAISVYWTGSFVTANFGATTMAYSPPSWYNQWFYN